MGAMTRSAWPRRGRPRARVGPAPSGRLLLDPQGPAATQHVSSRSGDDAPPALPLFDLGAIAREVIRPRETAAPGYKEECPRRIHASAGVGATHQRVARAVPVVVALIGQLETHGVPFPYHRVLPCPDAGDQDVEVAGAFQEVICHGVLP